MTDSDVRESLEVRWRRILTAGLGLYNLAEAGHPLRIYIGGNSLGDPTLTLVLSERPPGLAKFSLLTIETRRRDDGTWLLLLQLESLKAFREFVAMCGELIGASRNQSSEPAALAALLTSLDHWRNLFRPSGDQLTESQLRGLAAELICMSRVLRPSRSWAEIIYGWIGPAQAPQDFRLSGNKVLEVKSMHRDSTAIRIASLEQLSRGSAELLLATVVVDREIEFEPGVVTVPGLAREIESLIGGELELLEEFRAKLHEAHLDLVADTYEETFFTIGEIKLYQVVDEFPRLEREQVQSDILFAEYRLAVGGLGAFQREIESFFPGASWN